MFQMNGAVVSNNASSSHSAVETLNNQGLVRQYSGFTSTYLVVVNPISPSLVSRQEDGDNTVAFQVTTTLLPTPLTPVTPQRLVSSTASPVANLARPPFLQTAPPQLAAGNVELRPSLRPISGILPSVPSFQPLSCTNLVPDTPVPNQISQIGQRTSGFQPRALRRLLPKVTTESVKPSVSTENADSYKGLEASGVHCNSNSSPMCKTSSFSHLGGPATYCQTSSSTSVATRDSVKVPASVNAVAGANIEVPSNMMLPTKAKETFPSLVEKMNKDIVCSVEKRAMPMQPSAVQTKVTEQSTISQSSDSYSAPIPNGPPVHCTVNNSRYEIDAVEPHTSTSTQDSTGVFMDAENESLGNYRLSGKEGRSLCIDDSVSLEQDSLEKQACLSTSSHNPTRVAIEEENLPALDCNYRSRKGDNPTQVAIEEENLPALDCNYRSKKGDWSLHVDSATDQSGYQFVKTVLDVRKVRTTLNSGEPVRNFQTLVTCSASEKNETDHFHGAVSDSKCHFDESVLDACIMTNVSAGTVGNKNSQAHRSCSAIEKNSWSQVIDHAVTNSSNQSHGARPDTHINSNDSASIAVDNNVPVQDKKVCHLVWQDNDIDSQQVFSFTDIGCEHEKAEVQGEANSCNDNLKRVDSNRRPVSKGTKSSLVRRKQPVRACKCLHTSASIKTGVLERKPQEAKKRETSHLTISVPNCIGHPCIVVMGRLNDKVIKSGHVNLTTVTEETLFMSSTSLEVKLFPGKIISVASCATIQDIHDQPSAEQTQGDDLSKLLEERRAYMSQLHSVFHTTDHSSM